MVDRTKKWVCSAAIVVTRCCRIRKQKDRKEEKAGACKRRRKQRAEKMKTTSRVEWSGVAEHKVGIQKVTTRGRRKSGTLFQS
jgi:hypothetical protein